MGIEVKTAIESELAICAGSITWASGTVAGSRIAFAEGVTYSWDETNVPIWDRGTFSHWKKGRGAGELTVPAAYVDNMSMIDYLATGTVSGSTAPKIQAELRVVGTAGAMERCIQFKDIALKHFERNEPEGDDKISWSMGFDIMKEPTNATASTINTA